MTNLTIWSIVPCNILLSFLVWVSNLMLIRADSGTFLNNRYTKRPRKNSIAHSDFHKCPQFATEGKSPHLRDGCLLLF